MPITHHGTAIFVRDMAPSRQFYEELLEQPVQMDNGPHISFGTFSLWNVDHANQTVFGSTTTGQDGLGADNLELCFESDQLDEVYGRASQAGVEILQPIAEQPWGQRVFRMRDPDGHIVSVGEPLASMVRRLLDQGLSIEAVSEQTTIPVGMIENLVGGP